MSGRITRLAVQQGETAVPGTFNKDAALLLTISDMSVLETKVKVDETDVARLHVGDTAQVQIDAFPDTTFLGKVTEIAHSSVTARATAAPAARPIRRSTTKCTCSCSTLRSTRVRISPPPRRSSRRREERVEHSDHRAHGARAPGDRESRHGASPSARRRRRKSARRMSKACSWSARTTT